MSEVDPNKLHTTILQHKAHSFDKLMGILKEKGYPIARRTIAKYREQLGIPVARLRKEI